MCWARATCERVHRDSKGGEMWRYVVTDNRPRFFLFFFFLFFAFRPPIFATHEDRGLLQRKLRIVLDLDNENFESWKNYRIIRGEKWLNDLVNDLDLVGL